MYKQIYKDYNKIIAEQICEIKKILNNKQLENYSFV